MGLLAPGAVALAFFVWLGRRSSARGRTEWRVAAGFMALAALLAGSVFGVRGAWLPALACLFAGLIMALLSRRPERRRVQARGMGVEEARSVLGVGPEAGPEDIRAAYVRLMRRVHPDAGGAPGLAAQLNAARDRLLDRSA